MRFKCGVCGYIYDEEKEGVPFSDLPDDWVCPVCGEGKEGFEPVEDDFPPVGGTAVREDTVPDVESREEGDLRELTAGQLSALCSNLKRGCAVQQLSREAELFGQISDYFDSKAVRPDHDGVESLLKMINLDLGMYTGAKASASLMSDRGSLRALTWSEKATLMMKSVLQRYLDDPSFLEHTGVYVCDVCGFVYIGDDPPAVCPVCKVPGHMILRIKGVA